MKTDTPLFEHARKLKESLPSRSFVNQENGRNNTSDKRPFGRPKKSRTLYRNGIRPKNIVIHIDDWVTLHRYATMRHKYMSDVMHDLIEPLKQEIKKEQTLL